ncbi:MAG: AEC family transporter [Magnetovibrio sp.]|nr:AEC family transporter [Magnetovibrio sp.]
MTSVINALAPVFVLIVIGYALKRQHWVDDGFWPPAERITYRVFFPALLIASGARADLSGGEAWPMAATLFSATLATALLALILKPVLGLKPAAFTSFFQGTIRPNTYVGVVAAFLFWGEDGLALISIGILAVVPLVNVLSVTVLVIWGDGHEGARSIKRAISEVIRNPLILACLAGFAINLAGLSLPPVIEPLLDILGRAALPIALMAVGAGLDFPHLKTNATIASVSSALKIVILPAIAWSLASAFGLEGQAFQVVILYATMPVSASAYVLARELGGDSALIAGIITASTLAAVATMPVWITFAQ